MVSHNGHLRVELSVEKRRVDVGPQALGPHLQRQLHAAHAADPAGGQAGPGHEEHAGRGHNLHVHGLHVSPSGNADDIFIHIHPGQTFHYSYQFPATLRAGTYWYHPHPHLTSAPQVAGGMSGILIVDGLQQYLPASLAPHHRTRHRSQGLPTPGRRDQDPESAHRRVHASHRQRPTESDHSHSSG
ncbi:multicopper oxidase domain-containing protein [Streptomyces sp. NPDC058475]|uniref:multicopper oxidase domain-containing protein n=1 Tax=Streptomyces sp. NPDC058475 TaxID=3346518 RepID=UPI003651CCBF